MKRPENIDTTTAADELARKRLTLDREAESVAMSSRLTEEIEQRRDAEADLALANQILEAKHTELTQRNVTLQQVLNRIEEERSLLTFRIRSNIDRLVKPIVQALRDKANPVEKRQLQFLSSSLEQAAAPLSEKLHSAYARLTPREVVVSNMVRDGLTSKQIGNFIGLSEATVRKHRRNIRKKLGIAGKPVNLSSYLKTI